MTDAVRPGVKGLAELEFCGKGKFAESRDATAGSRFREANESASRPSRICRIVWSVF